MDQTLPADGLMPWEIIFWDVGQGDATSIRLPTGEYILIDTGPVSATSGSNPLVQWLLNTPEKKRIKCVLITHNDLDHVGGLISLASDDSLVIDSVLLVPDETFRQKLGKFAGLVAQLKKRQTAGKTQIGFLTQSNRILGDGMCRLAVRYPAPLDTAGKHTNNEISAVITLERNDSGNVSVIWGGDTLLSTVAKVCSRANPAILVGPHHGAPQDTPNKEKTFRSFLEDIRPEIFFVSVGQGNIYGHPKTKFIKAAVNAGTEICCSEITEQCHEAQKMATHVFQGSFQLGLPIPRHAIQCRGSMRVFANDMGIEFDQHQECFKECVRKIDGRLCHG